MELNGDDDDRPTPRTLLGRRLRRLREAAGLSQRELADQVGYPHTYISRVERGEQLPSEALAKVLDAYFSTDCLFVELLEIAHDTSIADYSRKIVSSEDKASRIQVFDSSLIPGLLQTEDYARASFGTLPGVSEDRVNELAAARMRRKRIFAKEEPPSFWVILDEAALKRPTGGAECMRGQLAYLLEMAQTPYVTVQVLAFAQGEHPMPGGTLNLVTLHNGSTIGYVESFASGVSVESAKRVLELTERFDVVRAQALSVKESLAVIRMYLGEYEHADNA